MIWVVPFWSSGCPRPRLHWFPIRLFFKIYLLGALPGPGQDFIDYQLDSHIKSTMLELQLAQAQFALMFNQLLIRNLPFWSSGWPRPRCHWLPIKFWFQICKFGALADPGPDIMDHHLNSYLLFIIWELCLAQARISLVFNYIPIYNELWLAQAEISLISN